MEDTEKNQGFAYDNKALKTRFELVSATVSSRFPSSKEAKRFSKQAERFSFIAPCSNPEAIEQESRLGKILTESENAGDLQTLDSCIKKIEYVLNLREKAYSF